MISCQLERTPTGYWLLSFNFDPHAGLLFDSDELAKFIQANSVGGYCSIDWYDKARTFPECPF